MPPVFKVGGNSHYRFYNPAEDRLEFVRKIKSESEFPDDDDEYKLVGSSHGWLAVFNPRNNDLFLWNPITGRHMKLPPIQTLPDPDINLTRDGRGSVSKVILSCCPDADECCRAMMTFGPRNRLAFCHPGHSTEWTPIGQLYFMEEEQERGYEDMVYCSGRKVFCCTTQLKMDFWEEHCPITPTHFEVWDLFSSPEPDVNIFAWDWAQIEGGGMCSWLNENRRELTSSSCRQIPYLVYAEQHDQMFVVIRFVMERVNGGHSDNNHCSHVVDNVYKTIGFSVLKLEYQLFRPLVDEMRLMDGSCYSLDGLAMFVGANHACAVALADDELWLKPNSIYFTDSNKNPALPPDSIYGGHDIGVFNYDSKTISPCYYPCDVDRFRKLVPAPIWFTPTPHSVLD